MEGISKWIIKKGDIEEVLGVDVEGLISREEEAFNRGEEEVTLEGVEGALIKV